MEDMINFLITAKVLELSSKGSHRWKGRELLQLLTVEIRSYLFHTVCNSWLPQWFRP